MKNVKMKCIIALFLSSLFCASVFADANLSDGSSSIDNGVISTTSATLTQQKTYTSVEEFEKAEGAICQSATDGCNNYFLSNGKVAGGTLALCIDSTPVWSCTKYIGEEKTYKTKEEFEKVEGAICQTATDACNTYLVGNDGKVGPGTLKACLDTTTAWSCVKYKEAKKESKVYSTVEDFEKAEGLTCKSVTDGCNTFTVSVNGKVSAGTLKACENFTPAWTCTENDVLVDILSSNDLKTYLDIKAGKLVPEAITTIESFTKKYVDKLAKMTNEVKKTNLNVLLVSIDKYTTDLLNEKNVKNLQLKLYILQLLKFNIQKEIYLLNLPTDTTINLEYNCSDNEKLTLQIVGDTLTLNDNKTRMLYSLDRVVSASGEKFEDEINTIWLKGSEAIFYRNSTEFYKNCVQK